MNSELVYRLNNLAYNIFPFGGIFFLGCMALMYTLFEINETEDELFGVKEGMPWPRFWKLIALCLLLFSELPLRSFL